MFGSERLRGGGVKSRRGLLGRAGLHQRERLDGGGAGDLIAARKRLTARDGEQELQTLRREA